MEFSNEFGTFLDFEEFMTVHNSNY